MKLCPQCDFIYEDDQSVCDMDGKELVFEPTLTAFPGNPLREQSVPRTRAQTLRFPGFPRFRRLAVTAMTGLMLGATLVLFYYLFTEGVSSAKPTVAPTSTSNPILPVPKKSGSPAALAAPIGSGSTTLAEETGNADFQSATAGSSSNAVPQALLQAAAPANSTSQQHQYLCSLLISLFQGFCGIKVRAREVKLTQNLPSISR